MNPNLFHHVTIISQSWHCRGRPIQTLPSPRQPFRGPPGICGALRKVWDHRIPAVQPWTVLVDLRGLGGWASGAVVPRVLLMLSVLMSILFCIVWRLFCIVWIHFNLYWYSLIKLVTFARQSFDTEYKRYISSNNNDELNYYLIFKYYLIIKCIWLIFKLVRLSMINIAPLLLCEVLKI